MSEEAGRSYWERHARSYDRSMVVLGKPMPRMIALVAEAARGKEKALEIGCGSGLVTEALAASAKDVVATDYADEMVAMTAARLRAKGATNVRCARADLYDLPFGDRAFDVVVAANVLHLVPDLEGALRAMTRVLAPGGTLVAPTFLHAETTLARMTSRLLSLTGFPGARRFDRGSLRAALEGAGWTIDRDEALPGFIPIGYVQAKRP